MFTRGKSVGKRIINLSRRGFGNTKRSWSGGFGGRRSGFLWVGFRTQKSKKIRSLNRVRLRGGRDSGVRPFSDLRRGKGIGILGICRIRNGSQKICKCLKIRRKRTVGEIL